MLGKISFRATITFSIFLIYLIFSISVFYIFNNSYLQNTRQKYIEQNNYSSKVAKDLIEQEKQKLFSGARIIASDDIVFYAFKNNLYINAEWNFKENIAEATASKTNKMRYIQLANMQRDRLYGKSRGVEEKHIAFFNDKFEQSGFSAGYPKEFLDTGKEKYLIDSKGDNNVGGVEISFIQKKDENLFIKCIAPIGKNRRVIEERYNNPGVLTIGEVFGGELLDTFKSIINSELILVHEDKILTSTLFKDSMRIEKKPIKIIMEKNSENSFFREAIINDRKMGFTFFPLFDYNKNIIAYLGTGFYYDDIEALYKKNTQKFFTYEVVFSTFILLLIYIFLRVMFRPFNAILKVLKKIDEGMYNQRLSIKTWKEFRLFAESINSLSDSVEKRESDLKELNQTLEEKVEIRTTELKENIERLKLTKEQLVVTEKVASIGKLAGGIAHEINSPLGAILTSAQYMKLNVEEVETEELKIELKESILTIEDAAKKSKNIIGKLLSYTEGGTKASEVFDIKDLVSNSLMLFQNDFDKLSIKSSVVGEKGVLIKGSFAELVSVITNVISNSRDALEKKDISNKEIEVKLYGKNEKAYIEIFDNGVGIKEVDKIKIFDPFFTTKDVGKGMGLGLTISYDIIKKHNASMRLESDFGVGTRVVIEFEQFK